MPTYPLERIRLLFEMNRVTASDDAITESGVDAWARTDWRIEMAFSFNDVMQDISNFASLEVFVMPESDRTAAALITKTTADFTPVLTLEDWQAGTDYQAAVEFSAAETNLDLGGETSKKFYFVAKVNTLDGKVFIAGYSSFTVVESGAFKDGEQPLQGGNVVPGGATYNGSGEYSLAVNLGALYEFTKGVNDTGYENGGAEVTADGNFTAAVATLTLKGSAGQAVTSIIRSAVYVTTGDADARYLTHQITVSQVAHGFAVGDVVRMSGASYVKAIADGLGNAEAVGVVAYASTNSFIYVTSGVMNLSGLTPGSLYYLSAVTAGTLTATEPIALGTVSKPVLFALTSSRVLVVPQRSRLNVDPDGMFSQVLTGTKNGINVTFTTPSDFVTGTTRLYKNGIRQSLTDGHYTESGSNTIVFADAPESGDILSIDYTPV